MTAFPVPLDRLISYVESIHPQGGPLENLSDAILVAGQLDETSDALIGYFVDRARSSGASWSQIGTSMGISKQGAQKRFVSRGEDVAAENARFSRFTLRARRAIAAAGQIAASLQLDAVDVKHIVAGLLSEPDGVAAKAVHQLSITDEQIYDALGVRPATVDYDSSLEALRQLHFTEASKESLKGALKAALRFGHNYIGTEHLLLGPLSVDREVAETLAGLGLTLDLANRAVVSELTKSP